MSPNEKKLLARKFHNIFKLVSASENHQHPELIDKANQILRYLSKMMPPQESDQKIFEPLPYVEHPALATAQPWSAKQTNSREVNHA